MARTCYKCGKTKQNIYFTKGYYWCNMCLGRKSKIPEYTPDELLNMGDMQICNICKKARNKKLFDLRKWITQPVPIYGKTCKYCRDKIKERKIKHKREKEELHYKMRSRMIRLVNDESGRWKWQNERALLRIRADFGTNPYPYFSHNMWRDKQTRDLVETKTAQINIIDLLKDKKKNNNVIKKLMK